MGRDQKQLLTVSCQEVRAELSNFIDGDVSPQLRERLEAHLSWCRHCTAILDGLRNVIYLLSTGEVFDLPPGFAQRLYRRLTESEAE